MFREMRRNNQQIPENECKLILKNEWRGVLSLLGDNDYPYGIPMNFLYCEEENKIYFHGSKIGHKIDAIKNHDKACFTIFDKGVKRENHWSLDIKSVIIFGKISIIEDREKAAHQVRMLAQKYFPDHSEIEGEMSAHFAHAECLELTVEHMTGKTVNES